MNLKKECCETHDNRLVVFRENRSKLTIENKDEVPGTKVHVDGCQITEGKRCDYLYLIKNTEMYIELKGQDIHHAVEQIKDTIVKLSRDKIYSKKISFVICARSPLDSAGIQNIRVKFRKEHNSDFIVKSSPYSYKY